MDKFIRRKTGEFIAILGAGNMGTALAKVAAHNTRVILWSIEPEVVKEINESHTNSKYLQGIQLPGSIKATGNLKEAVSDAKLVVVAVPSHIVPEIAKTLAPLLSKNQYVLNVAKGIDEQTLKTSAEILRDTLPKPLRPKVATLSGPSIANEFGAGKFCAVMIAAPSIATAEKMAEFFRCDYFKVKTSQDFRGVALGGVLKNIYAIALGMADGLKLGMNTKAALIWATLEELKRLFFALGAKSETAFSLAGIGDLIVTGMSEHSRNRRFGEELCIDAKCKIKMSDPTQTIEGIRAAKAVAKFAESKTLRTPILFAVDSVLFEKKSPQEAMKKILTVMLGF